MAFACHEPIIVLLYPCLSALISVIRVQLLFASVERGEVARGLDGLEEGVGDLDVAGDQLAAAGFGDVELAHGGAAEVRDAAAGFAHQQHARGDVPRLQAGFEVGVGAAAGHVGQVQRGRTGAADVLGVAQQLAHALELGAGAHAFARREAGDEHRPGKVLAFGDADAALVERRAAAAAGGEQLVAERIEDDAVDRLAILDQRDRYAPMRPAVQVIAGAVERVDYPGAAARTAATLLRAAFLAQDGVLGVGPAQFLDDRFLGQPVDFAGVVHPLLLDDVQRVELVHVPQQHAAAGAGRLDHDVDGGLEHGGTTSG